MGDISEAMALSRRDAYLATCARRRRTITRTPAAPWVQRCAAWVGGRRLAGATGQPGGMEQYAGKGHDRAGDCVFADEHGVRLSAARQRGGYFGAAAGAARRHPH